jgi:hypothetical protein
MPDVGNEYYAINVAVVPSTVKKRVVENDAFPLTPRPRHSTDRNSATIWNKNSEVAS